MTYTFDPMVQFDPVALNKMYQDCFGYKADGTFVEVGGYDGVSYSHTVGLARLGWRGVYVEPRPDLVGRCMANHTDSPNVTVLRVAAGSVNGDGKIYIDDNSCCGSTSNRVVAPNGRVVNVQMRTLDTILEFERIKPGFDLFSLDIEFNEMDVLKGWNHQYWMPKMMIIELCEYHPEPKHTWSAELRDYCKKTFLPLGYRLIYNDMINGVFVRP